MSTPAPVDPSRTRLLVVLVVAAAACLAASAVLSIEAISAADAYRQLPEGSRPESFPAPKAFLGLASQPVVVTLAVAGLAGVQLPRWLMLSVNGAYLIGLVAAYVFLLQLIMNGDRPSFWRLVLVVTATVVFVTLTLVNVRDRRPPHAARDIAATATH